ncbi:MAG: hypothetical protein AAGC46_01470 [Solirubrobacteraceae bacterium]|nr:hypothetical protein [Patulibacter sp.]
MPSRLPVPRSAATAALLLVLGLSACGEKPLPGPPTSKVDPSTAEHALRDYLDNDRCDLLSDTMASAISPNPSDGRLACENGALPVDAYVRPGQYTITRREIIDGNGIFSIALKDGGTRDYVLTPGGPDKFQIDQVTSHTTALIGEPLRLQARLTATSPLVDARVVVDSIARIPRSTLSDDEYTSSLDKYYKAHITITSRSKTAETIGSTAFTVAEAHGVKLADSQIPFSDIGPLLPPNVDPKGTISGYVFFDVPNVKAAKPGQIVLTYGSGDTGAKLVWTTRAAKGVVQAPTT